MNLDNFLKDLKGRDLKNNVPSVSATVGCFLANLVKKAEAERILEIGTAHGYSTLHLVKNLPESGKVITYEFSKPSFEAAKINFYQARQELKIEQRFGNVKACKKLLKERCFDLVFIDGQKTDTLSFWKLIQPVVHEKTIVVVDDVEKFSEKMKEFLEFIKTQSKWKTQFLPLDEDDSILVLDRGKVKL